MKYCSNCGQPLPDFAKFCPKCGKEQFSMPKEAPVEEPAPEVINNQQQVEQQQIVQEPVIEETAPIIEENPVEEAPVTEETPTIEETPKPQNKWVRIYKFLIYKEPLKYSIIFFAGLFAISLLFWILSTQVLVLGIFKFLARSGAILVFEIIKNKTNNLFDFLWKAVFAVLHLFLFILNFIFMVI